jgi:hypothetical protein
MRFRVAVLVALAAAATLSPLRQPGLAQPHGRDVQRRGC